MPKLNGEDWDYLVVKRLIFFGEKMDWNEFESTVHAYTRMGYKPQGGIAITVVEKQGVFYAQAMYKEIIK
jgi:hypothetical protein